jgi:coenzyme F420-dependent glucose-6-phosphate dehydrogenase
MTAIGYALSSEEHTATDLVRHARRAEEAGFSFAVISDHYHPWIDRQGQSPFVWGVLGAIAQATERLRVGTGVTCPTVRIHPAIIAQASATAAALMPGRFFLGLGTGERLNEHILGAPWPEPDMRAEMLAEAVEVIRELWKGSVTSHHGRHYTVDSARIYSLPDPLPPIYMAAGGPKAAQEAARLGDGLISTAADKELVDGYTKAGGGGPRIGQITVCWARTQDEARRIAREWWPTVALHGEVSQELPSPAHFEQLTKSVTEDQVAALVPCGPDVELHASKINEYVDAGYDQVYIHQVGPDQAGFIKFAEGELLPALRPEAMRIAS